MRTLLVIITSAALALAQQAVPGPGLTGAGGGGGGGATIPSTTNLISGDGAGNGANSGIVPANVALLNGVNVFTNNFSVTNGGSNGYSLFGASQSVLPLNTSRDHFYFGFADTITGNSRGLTQVYEFSGVSSSGGIKNGLSANANTVNTTTGALTNTGSGGFAGGRFLVQHEGSGLVSRASAITGRVTESNIALGTITDVATINAEAPILDAAQTWTSYAGLRVNSAATIGTITTNYGVRVDSLLSGATKWAYYAQTDPSFFGGAVTTPNLTLSSLTTGIAHVGSGGVVTSSAILDAELPASVPLLASNNTFTGRYINSLNGAVSAPPFSLTGTWFTGGSATTTKPQYLIECNSGTTTSTAWNTNGTGLGVNACTGFSGNAIDVQLNGVSKFRVDANGNSTAGTGVFGTVQTQYLTDTSNAKGYWDTSASGINWKNINKVTGNINVAIDAVASQTADLTEWRNSSQVKQTWVDVSGNLSILPQKATTGTRYLCIDTTGLITSSAAPCAGT